MISVVLLLSWPWKMCNQVGLLNVDGYYDSLLALFDKGVEEGFIDNSARNIVVMASTAEELIKKMEVGKEGALLEVAELLGENGNKQIFAWKMQEKKVISQCIWFHFAGVCGCPWQGCTQTKMGSGPIIRVYSKWGIHEILDLTHHHAICINIWCCVLKFNQGDCQKIDRISLSFSPSISQDPQSWSIICIYSKLTCIKFH